MRKNLFRICVGMQMLANKGFENGEFTGLGWIEGDVKKLKHLIILLKSLIWVGMICN